MKAALLRWLDQDGGEVREEDGSRIWSAHSARIVEALARDGDSFLPIEGVIVFSIKNVFGGENSERCDNLFLVRTLVLHAPMPIDGFVLYAEAGSAEQWYFRMLPWFRHDGSFRPSNDVSNERRTR